MNKNQAAAYVQSQVACALIELASMQAANLQHFASNGQGAQPYSKEDIEALIEKWGIHHNAVHQYIFVTNED